ncbi:MAG: hypothetical protein JO040_05210 [Gemmatimonadetes bacterium]|nr:hypothetical protein [Gemmatimonadota bacterium]
MSPEGDRTRRARLFALLSLVVVFIAGTLVGAAAEHARGRPGGGPGRGGPGRPEIFAAQGELAKRLHLTPSQSDSIQKIVTRSRAEADAMFREMRPRLRARFDSTTTAIDAVLTPQQRAEFKRIRDEHRAERRGRGGGSGWPGGPGGPEGGPGGPPPPPEGH